LENKSDNSNAMNGSDEEEGGRDEPYFYVTGQRRKGKARHGLFTHRVKEKRL